MNAWRTKNQCRKRTKRRRFKAVPIEQDQNFLTMLRHVERNQRRAGLVRWAEDWP
jgi:hypothetical protein